MKEIEIDQLHIKGYCEEVSNKLTQKFKAVGSGKFAAIGSWMRYPRVSIWDELGRYLGTVYAGLDTGLNPAQYWISYIPNHEHWVCIWVGETKLAPFEEVARKLLWEVEANEGD